MRESANQSENRLLYYLNALNAAFTTNESFPPMFDARSVKTAPNERNRIARRLKTKEAADGHV